MKLFLQKNCKILSAGGGGLCPQTPSLRRLGASPPDPHWPPAAGGSAPRPPKQPPHCEFLATRLLELMIVLCVASINTHIFCSVDIGN